MTRQEVCILQFALVATILFVATSKVSCDDTSQIPYNPSQINGWFQSNVKRYHLRKGTLNSTLQSAESKPKIIRVRKDGSGDYKNLTYAIKNVPTGNSQRILIEIGPGVYTEKVTIDRSKPFITLYGSPNNMPTLQFDGTAKQYGTFYSATLQVESDFFIAANIIIRNTAPRPDGKRVGAQAVAMRIAGDNAAFYNCKFIGFQDTLCDEDGHHFFKDCFIRGTVDFIFGNGKSLYLRSEINVISDNGLSFISAQGRENSREDTGYSFVHCNVTGTGSGAYLGRAWMESPEVVYAYSSLGTVVNPLGWSDNQFPDRDGKVMFGEYKNSGPGANIARRAKFSKQFTPEQASPFLSLGYVKGSKWLLPPPQFARRKLRRPANEL